MKKLMTIISVIFHPLLMASYLCSILLYYFPELIPGTNTNGRLYILLVIFITTFVIPALSIYSLKTFSIIDSLSLEKRTERFYPFVLICVFYGITGYLFVAKLRIPPPLSTMIVGTASLVLLLSIITKWIKISIHAAATWATTGYVSALYLTKGFDLTHFLYLFILISGITCMSRLFLNKHTPTEIWLGTIVGFLFSHLVIFVFT